MIIDNGFLRCYNTNRRYFIPFCELPFHPVSMVGQPENSPRRAWCPAKPSRQFACATSPKEVSNMSKRFTALLMALVLVVGVLAVPASAATGEIIQPQSIPGCQCAPPNVVTRWDEANYSVRLTTCYFAMPNCRGDYAAMKYEGQKCTKCGHSTNRKPVESGGFCPVVGNYKYPSIGRGVSVGLSATVLS